MNCQSKALDSILPTAFHFLLAMQKKGSFLGGWGVFMCERERLSLQMRSVFTMIIPITENYGWSQNLWDQQQNVTFLEEVIVLYLVGYEKYTVL